MGATQHATSGRCGSSASSSDGPKPIYPPSVATPNVLPVGTNTDLWKATIMTLVETHPRHSEHTTTNPTDNTQDEPVTYQRLFQIMRYYGLGTAAIAHAAAVPQQEVRDWLFNRATIPQNLVAAAIADLARTTDGFIEDIAPVAARTGTIPLYRTTSALRQAREDLPGFADITWWRRVVARAAGGADVVDFADGVETPFAAEWSATKLPVDTILRMTSSGASADLYRATYETVSEADSWDDAAHSMASADAARRLADAGVSADWLRSIFGKPGMLAPAGQRPARVTVDAVVAVHQDRVPAVVVPLLTYLGTPVEDWEHVAALALRADDTARTAFMAGADRHPQLRSMRYWACADRSVHNRDRRITGERWDISTVMEYTETGITPTVVRRLDAALMLLLGTDTNNTPAYDAVTRLVLGE